MRKSCDFGWCFGQSFLPLPCFLGCDSLFGLLNLRTFCLNELVNQCVLILTLTTSIKFIGKSLVHRSISASCPSFVDVLDLLMIDLVALSIYLEPMEHAESI